MYIWHPSLRQWVCQLTYQILAEELLVKNRDIVDLCTELVYVHQMREFQVRLSEKEFCQPLVHSVEDCYFMYSGANTL